MGCFAHIRRKLVEVMDVAPKGTVIKETQTYKMYQLINKLFYLEKVYDKKYKKDYDRITRERKTKSLPVLEEFYEIVKTVAPHTPKKSHLDTAMTYAISNNSAERCCKSFVIGRKNFLFSNSINGAKASGAAYSIIESAKINGLKPYEYIEYILTRMTGNKLTADLLEKIMPWSEELPKNLYKNKKA